MNANVRAALNNEFTLNIDLALTISAAAGVQRPQKMMGRNIADLYKQPEQQTTFLKQTEKSIPWRQDFFYEHPTIRNAVFIPSSEALVCKKYKYIYWPNFDLEQMFHLVEDPNELHDLINSTDTIYRDKLQSMQIRFKELKRLIQSDKQVMI